MCCIRPRSGAGAARRARRERGSREAPGGRGGIRARPGGPRARRTGDRRRVSRGRFRATPRGARARGVPDARGDAAGGWRGNGRGADDGTCRRETTGSGDGAREAVPVPGGGRRSRTRGDREGRVAFASRSSRTLSPPPCASVIATEGGGSRRAPVPSRSRSVPPRAGAERGVRAPNARGGREPGEEDRRGGRGARGEGGDATSGASGGARVAGSDGTRRAARNNDERKTPPTAGRVTSVDRSAPSAQLRSGRREPSASSIFNDSAGGKLHARCC